MQKIIRNLTVILIVGTLVGMLTPMAFAEVADHVVISEIQIDSIDGAGGTTDDFIELYNPTDQSIDLAASSYRLERWTSGGTNDIAVRFGNISDATYPGGTTIPAGGFYLVVDNDATDAGLHNNADALITRTFALSDDYSIGLGTNPIDGPNDTDTIDFVGWGTNSLYEGPAAAPNPPDAQSLQRKVDASSNEDGAHGPAWDTNDNSSDFFTQTSPYPQHSSQSLPPVPELAIIILFAFGILIFGGYFWFKNRSRDLHLANC